jgi:TolB-like protein/DNA-binding winged helix-turn-helix (wHTH) protein/Tfp pilus assembly protein PilF
MENAPKAVRTARFGPFEVDFRAGELLKHGRRIRLQNQPLQILAMLLEQPGEVVTREELRQKLWPSDTFVDFDHGLNNAINRLREVLGDSAENPRFIETLPRRGYRFTGLVESVTPDLTADSSVGQPAISSAAAIPEPVPPSLWTRLLRPNTLAVAAVLLLGLLLMGLTSSRWRESLTGGTERASVASIAVLPLENLTGDSSKDYLADGITDALTTQLAQVPGIRVTSRTSAAQYKKQKKPLPQIARELGVDAVVEGTLQLSGERLSISTQLIDARTDQHLWARIYERELRELPSWHIAAARDIASELRLPLSLHNQERLARDQRIQPEAYDYYLRAQPHFGIQTKEENNAAIELLQKAVALDSNFAEAYAALGTAYEVRAFEIEPEQKQWEEKSFAAIQKALQLEPNLADGYVARGHLLWSLANHFPHEKAAQDFRRAVALNPNLAEAHHQLANIYNHIGLLDKAEEEIEKAVALDPLNTGARFRVGINLLYRGNYEQSLLAIRDSQRFNPPLWAFQTSYALFQLGRREEARERVEQFMGKYPEDPGGLLASMQALLAAAAGERTRAEERIRVALTKEHGYGHFHHTAYAIASAYALMKQPDLAIRHLQKLAEEGFPCYPLFERDPNLDNLRQNPRFIEFMAKQKKQWEYFKTITTSPM